MKRIIYKPNVGEAIPNGAVQYTLPESGFVIDAIVDDNFDTQGTIFYDSLESIDLPEPFIHHFSGWEV